MFQMISADESDKKSEGGTRPFFTLGHFEFRDALDGEGGLHHFVLESSETAEEPAVYETNRATMYEFMDVTSPASTKRTSMSLSAHRPRRHFWTHWKSRRPGR